MAKPAAKKTTTAAKATKAKKASSSKWKDRRCLRCQGEMVAGTLHNVPCPWTVGRLHWGPGLPGEGGLVDEMLNATAGRSGALPVVSLRCRDCGCVEIVAE